MLAYARHHGLSCPFTASIETLTNDIHQKIADESDLSLPFPRNNFQPHSFLKEQLRIPRSAASLLTEVLSPPCPDDVVDLERRVSHNLDYPLELRQAYDESAYTVPSSLAEAFTNLKSLRLEDAKDLFEDMQSILNQPDLSCLSDVLLVSDESAVFLEHTIHPAEQEDLVEPEIIVLSLVLQQDETHPHRVTWQTTIQNCQSCLLSSQIQLWDLL